VSALPAVVRSLVTPDQLVVELALEFAAIGQELARLENPESVYAVLCERSVERVPGAEFAGVTIGRGGQFTTVGATADTVVKVDAIQYRLGSGPCVDAAVQQEIFQVDDLRTDPRWPEFGRQATQSEGVTSMLSQRLYLEHGEDLVAGLNMYSTGTAAFQEPAASIAVLLATHGAIAVASAASRQKATNLTRALKNSREIGIAMGIIMSRLRITRDQAFDLLRIASQFGHRKIASIASEVADTGQLPTLPD
jgi:ANTAR domain-containing protein/GAF domain-containing protein